jgi:tetratricopeptide (TPR) repeat protein
MDTTTHRCLQDARRLSDAGRVDEAIAAFRALLAQAPGVAEAWYELGWLLRRQGRGDDALAAYAQALANGVSGPEEVHLNRAVIQTDLLHDHAAAEASLRAALSLAPDYAAARLNYGNLLEDLGRSAEAEAQYRALIDVHPVDPAVVDLQAEALARSLGLPGARQDDALLERAMHVARDEPTGATPMHGPISPITRANLWFAIGRALETRQRLDEAFAAFAAGNRGAAAGGPAYSPAGMTRAVDALVASFAAPSRSRATARPTALEPLFICGMFRSGSTLLEQVLAAHPQVVAGGEQPFFPQLASRLPGGYPASLSALGDATLDALARDYLVHRERLVPAVRRGARWFTDKRPDNVLLLDLITRVFPQARIVLTRRDPVDTGLSVYQQHLDQRQAPYSSDLAAIGHFSAQLRRWEQHLEAALGDRLRVFDYDAFVRDPEGQLRPLLDWLGLAWDARCLAFHAQASSVKTASVHQVRRPLYADSSGRWRRYAAHLGPLIDALRDAGMVDANGSRLG